jgi:uncharacterized membrane protein
MCSVMLPACLGRELTAIRTFPGPTLNLQETGPSDSQEPLARSRTTPRVAPTSPVAEAANELERRRAELHGAFGNDAFRQLAEKAARFFGTPHYIVGQTVAVLAWVVLNSTQLHLGFAWDVYPFIALNLLFSLQAAYAAPLILLAQTRQADHDKVHSERIEASHGRLEHAAKMETDKVLDLLQSNTDLTQQDKELTQQVADLTKQIHALLINHRSS